MRTCEYILIGARKSQVENIVINPNLLWKDYQLLNQLTNLFILLGYEKWNRCIYRYKNYVHNNYLNLLESTDSSSENAKREKIWDACIIAHQVEYMCILPVANVPSSLPR